MTGLAVNALSKRFGGLTAVNNVGFGIGEGEIVALIGPNGAGKSTLINVISGSYAPSGGTVVFGGADITGKPPYAINRLGLARTFQGVELFGSLTVRENVIVGGVAKQRIGIAAGMLRWPSVRAAEASLARLADEALDLVGLARQGNDRATILPAGQQRLLSVARALASGADWLLLDEPGAGLNAAEKAELARVIQHLHRGGKTIVFVEHDMGFVGALARRIIVLDRGEIIADGARDEIRTNDRVVSAYLGGRVIAGRATTARPAAARPLLEIAGLSVRFGGLTALHEVDVNVGQGEFVAIVGANGAGKSTLLKAVAGVVPSAAGQISVAGQDRTGASPRERVAAGIALVPEGRELFGSLSVLDNLRLGRYTRVGALELWLPQAGRLNRTGAETEERVEEVFRLFPRLGERRHQPAATLSGGEGRMLAVGRALMASPKLLMLDEPSLGLAPRVIAEIFERLLDLRDRGLTILLVEQNARAALEVADRGYVLETGAVKAVGPARALLEEDTIAAAYLGLQPGTNPEPAMASGPHEAAFG